MISCHSIMCAAAVLATSAQAQLMGATELKVAVPVKGAPSSKPVADVYYFVGEVGAKETYTLTAEGPASITLFGPDGSDILAASGSGSVRLDVVLPFTDVFTIAIARKTPGTRYSLSRKTTVPTLAEALLAGSVGYESKDARNSRCWLIPGIKLRTIYAAGREEYTLAADRQTITFVSVAPGGTTTGDTSYTLEGKTVHRTARYLDGRVQNDSFDVPISYDPTQDGRFTGYLCQTDSVKP